MIREATASDASAMAALERQLFDDPWSVQDLAASLGVAGRRAWVAEQAGVCHGYALTSLSGDFAEVLRTGVRLDSRRLGIARGLLHEALAAAREDGADRMLLEVSAANGPAVGFYTAEGFTRIDVRPRYYRDGSDALVLGRSLDRSLGRTAGSSPEDGPGGSGRMGP